MVEPEGSTIQRSRAGALTLAGHGYWMPELRVVALRICDVWRGFGLADKEVLIRFWVSDGEDFATPENEGPCRGSRCLLSGVKQTSISGD